MPIDTDKLNPFLIRSTEVVYDETTGSEKGRIDTHIQKASWIVNEEGFPNEPEKGEIAFKDEAFWIYKEISPGQFVWHRFTSATGLDYIHPASHPASMIVTDPNLRFIDDIRLAKLDAIESGANNYIHPVTHDATEIVQDSTHRFVTDAQIAAFLDHPATHPATMIDEDSTHRFVTDAERTKLSGIETNANNYVHPASHSASIITEDATHRFFTDTERTKLTGIAPNANNYSHPASHPATIITEDSTHRFITDVERTKLAGIASNANNYSHPTNHSPAIITQDINNRFVTDTQIAAWDAKLDGPFDDAFHGQRGGGNLHAAATISARGFMSATDKTKLDGIADGATNFTYTHPVTHPATMIDEDSTHRFVTDTQIANWDAHFEHPATHPPSIIVQDTGNRFVTDSQIADWDAKVDGPLPAPAAGEIGGVKEGDRITIDPDGTISADVQSDTNFTAAEKTKLSAIDTNANNYIHPASHPANIIVDDSAHRFVTDSQISDWDAKVDGPLNATSHGDLSGGTLHAAASTLTAGFMTATDKVKLNGIEAGANNFTYTHPGTHPASMIVEEADMNWFLDAERSKLAAIEDGANQYIHPTTHSASMIVEEIDRRFMDDAERIKLAGIEENANLYIHPATHSMAIMAETVDRKIMTDGERDKLAAIPLDANNYVHPGTHPATMIVEDSTHRFVADTDIAAWNTLSNYTHPTTHPASMIVEEANHNFLLDAERTKLAGIEDNANLYIHPATHDATDIVEDSTHRFVTDADISAWNTLSNYTHPTSHPATIIDQDTSHRFVTDTQIALWNAASNLPASTSNLGSVIVGDRLSVDVDGTIHADIQTENDFTDTLKNKLDAIETGANNYTHPVSHAPSIISQNTSNRFVTDAQIASWDAKLEGPVDESFHGDLTGGTLHAAASTLSAGFMSATDKTKLDAVASGANNYTHPATHNATIINQDSTHRFVTDAQISTWNNAFTLEPATVSTIGGVIIGSGLTVLVDGTISVDSQTDENFTAADKAKLDGIESGANNFTYTHPATHSMSMLVETATKKIFTDVEQTKLDSVEFDSNNYIHPTSHPADIIIQDSTHRFVTDIMLAKFATVEEGANNFTYEHPMFHDATIINQDVTHRFVTDAQINSWNNKMDGPFNDIVHGDRGGGTLHEAATTTAHGFMSSGDKTKLDAVEDGANAYVHPTTHDASEIVLDSDNRFVTDAQIASWDAKMNGPFTDTLHGDRGGGSLHTLASGTNHGFMSNANFQKLGAIQVNANNYVHPASHPATIIVQDSTHRMVTDAQISAWSAAGSAHNLDTHGDVSNTAPQDKEFLVYNSTSGLYEPTASVPITSGPTPPSSPDNGDTWLNSNLQMMFMYDGVRGKWLGNRETKIFYLKFNSVDGMLLGFGSERGPNYIYVHRNATITSIFCSIDSGNNTKEFAIRQDGVDVGSFVMGGNNIYKDNNADINIDEDTQLQVYCEDAGSSVRRPMVQIELAWRY